MNKIVVRALVGAFAVFFSACAHKPLAKPTGLTPSQFFQEQNARLAELKRISAKIGLSFQGVKEKGSGQGRLIAELPNHVRLELRDPLGTLRYLLTLSDEKLLAYYPTSKTAYSDTRAGRSYLLHLLGADLSFEELQGVFLGVLPTSFYKPTFDKWSWDEQTGTYEAVNEFKGKKVTLHVDANTATLKSLTLESEARGATAATYSDFSLCCGTGMRVGKNKSVELAHYVQLNHASSKTSVEIDWDEIQILDRPRPEALFREELPPGVQIHRLD